MTTPCYSQRLDQALAFVAEAFRHKRRKGSHIPYLTHLLQVMVTVAEWGGDEVQQCAALLHDYLEDIEGGSKAELQKRFGDDVADLVLRLSDRLSPNDAKPWRARKEAYLQRLREESSRVKLICVADKLHNAQSIARDRGQIGEVIWQRFHAPKQEVLWYYRELVTALRDGWNHPLLDSLSAEVAALDRPSTTSLMY